MKFVVNPYSLVIFLACVILSPQIHAEAQEGQDAVVITDVSDANNHPEPKHVFLPTDKGCSPLQVGLVESLQLVPKDQAVCGIRLGLLRVNNNDVWGIDIAGAGNIAGNMTGVQLGLLFNSAENMSGVQIAAASSWTKKDFRGMQLGIISNRVDGHMTGVQIGIFNMSKYLTGVQIGLINIATSSETAPHFFPIVNVGWD